LRELCFGPAHESGLFHILKAAVFSDLPRWFPLLLDLPDPGLILYFTKKVLDLKREPVLSEIAGSQVILQKFIFCFEPF